MRRRTLLATAGTGFAMLAGCAGSDEPEPEATAAANQEPAATPTEAPGAAETSTPTASQGGEPPTEQPSEQPLRLFSFDSPDRAEIGEQVRYTFTVENLGDEPQTVEPTTSARSDSGAWSEHDRWEAIELAPREFTSFESPPFTSQYLSTVELRIDGYDQIFSVEFEEKQLPFTNQYVDPRDREVSVEELIIRQSYEYTSDGTRYHVASGDGLQWVFVTVKTINRTDEPLVAPGGEGFTLRAGERTFRQVDLADDSGYESNRLPGGSGTSGRIAFKTPNPLQREDFTVDWEESFDEGDVAVVWTPK